MEALPKLDREELRKQMLSEFERTLTEVADAVDRAKAGRLIRDSEEPARVALDRFRQVMYETAMQAKVDAAEAAFSPSGQPSDRSADAA
jgi:UDP:flavonoid glycosyltransferase YjiC (YdhE family)